MVSVPRSSQWGFPVQLPRSAYTQVRFAPTLGFTASPDLVNPPGSITSGRNLWIWAGRLTPRPRLQFLGDVNILQDQPTGAWEYDDVNGVAWPMITSKRTVAYLNSSTWQALTYVSTSSNNPPSGGVNDLWHEVSTYLPRLDANIAVMANGVDPLFAWGGPSNGTGFSTLTQAPIAKDVAQLQNHLVAWNIRYQSSSSQLVTRVQWSARGDPEQWADPTTFAGYEDLLDMRGAGTRIFAQNDQLLLATEHELWRGQFVGAPFVFQFTPFSRQIGIPFPNAAIQTQDGLYWLGGDLMVYQLEPFWAAEAKPIGKAIQRSLHEQDADPTTSFFGYHPDSRQLTLYFTTTVGQEPMNGYTLEVDNGTWTPQLFQQALGVSFQAPIVSSAATQWNQLVGGFATQTLNYNQLLGLSTDALVAEALVSSAGTAYVLSHSATSDDGVAVTSEAELGTLFAGQPERKHFVDQVRFDLRTDTTSTVSVAVRDLSGQYGSEQTIGLSASSNNSQYLTYWGVPAVYHTVRIRSDAPNDWELNGVTVRAKDTGPAI